MRKLPALLAPAAASAAALALAAAPVAAQAAQASPERAAAPVEQGSELRSSWILAIFAIAAFIAAIALASNGDNEPVSA